MASDPYGPKPAGSATRGVKRRADESIESEQRLSKRFNLLNLEQNGKLWIYPQTRAHAPSASLPASAALSNDLMQVEETPEKIFIHNLDEELALADASPSLSIEVEPQELVFLPDIEKHLNRIPQHILEGDKGEAQKRHEAEVAGKEIVLYNVPASLSVAPERDSVRKAILESRARARSQGPNKLDYHPFGTGPTNSATPYDLPPHNITGNLPTETGVDPMEVD